MSRDNTGESATTAKIKRGRIGLALIAAFVAGSVVLAFTVRAHSRRVPAPSEAVKPSVKTPGPPAVAAVQSAPISNADLVHRGAMASQLHAAYQVLGGRLERPGKERVAMTGTLQRGGDAAAFALIWELPGPRAVCRTARRRRPARPRLRWPRREEQ